MRKSSTTPSANMEPRTNVHTITQLFSALKRPNTFILRGNSETFTSVPYLAILSPTRLNTSTSRRRRNIRAMTACVSFRSCLNRSATTIFPTKSAPIMARTFPACISPGPVATLLLCRDTTEISYILTTNKDNRRILRRLLQNNKRHNNKNSLPYLATRTTRSSSGNPLAGMADINIFTHVKRKDSNAPHC